MDELSAPASLPRMIDAGTGLGSRARGGRQGRRPPRHPGRSRMGARLGPGHPGGTVFDTRTGAGTLIAAAVSATSSPRSTAAPSPPSPPRACARASLYDESGREWLWACPNTDGRARASAGSKKKPTSWSAEGVADDIYRIAGDWISITAPARIRWIARYEPDVLAAARHFAHARATGSPRASPASSSPSRPAGRARRCSICARARGRPTSPRAVSIDPAILPPVVECGTVVGAVTAEASVVTGLPVGTPVVTGGADTQLALHGIAARPGSPTIVAGTFWQTTAGGRRAARRPEATAAHAVSRRAGRLDGGGHQLPLGAGDALVPRRVLPRCGGARRADRSLGLRRHGGVGLGGSRRGSNGVIAAMANVMRADAWHHAAPSFVGFDINDAQGSSRAASIRAIEEAAAIIAAGHLDILEEITGGSVRRVGGRGDLHRRLQRGHPLAAHHRRSHRPGTRVTPAPEATSYGAARLAAQGVGVSPAAHERAGSHRARGARRARDIRRGHRTLASRLPEPARHPERRSPTLFTPPGSIRAPLTRRIPRLDAPQTPPSQRRHTHGRPRRQLQRQAVPPRRARGAVLAQHPRRREPRLGHAEPPGAHPGPADRARPSCSPSTTATSRARPRGSSAST